MPERPEIDPKVYQDWPESSLKEKWEVAKWFVGQCIRTYDEVMEEKVGKEKAREIAAEAMGRVFTASYSCECLKGLAGSQKDAADATRVFSFMEEELFGLTSACLQASAESGTREIIKCSLGDVMRKEDCEYAMEGFKQFIETR